MNAKEIDQRAWNINAVGCTMLPELAKSVHVADKERTHGGQWTNEADKRRTQGGRCGGAAKADTRRTRGGQKAVTWRTYGVQGVEAHMAD